MPTSYLADIFTLMMMSFVKKVNVYMKCILTTFIKIVVLKEENPKPLQILGKITMASFP